MLKSITSKINRGEFDYTFLLSCLSRYKKPRNQITKLIKTKQIIRIKKGLYIFGKEINAPAYSKEILANLIYGPSYISLEYALSYYNLIPERVELITSVTTKRNKYFKTPIGDFSYKYINQNKYSTGITQIKIDQNRFALMATKEKALIDLLDKEKNTFSISDLKIHLIQNLRIEPEEIKKLSLKHIKEIKKNYKSKSIDNVLY